MGIYRTPDVECVWLTPWKTYTYHSVILDPMIGYSPAGIVRNAPTEYSPLFVSYVDDLVILGYGDRRDGSLIEMAEEVIRGIEVFQITAASFRIFFDCHF